MPGPKAEIQRVTIQGLILSLPPGGLVCLIGDLVKYFQVCWTLDGVDKLTLITVLGLRVNILFTSAKMRVPEVTLRLISVAKAGFSLLVYA